MTNVYRARDGRVLQLPSPLFLVLCNRRLVPTVTGICRAENSQWIWLLAAKPLNISKEHGPHELWRSPHKEFQAHVFSYFFRVGFLSECDLGLPDPPRYCK
jgi:hypothetical protein